MEILFSKRARREALDADDWCRANRQAAPRLFAHELEKGLRLLATAPFAGRRAEGVRKKDTRVLVLKHSRYLVFHRVVDDGKIRVFAVRHGRRDEDPTI